MRRLFLLTILLAMIPAPAPAADVVEGENYTSTRNLSYALGTTVPSRALLDVYVPREPRAAKTPVVVWIHGGGWFQGSKDSAIKPKAEALTGAGYVFVAINYRLSPFYTMPDSLSPFRVKFPDYPEDAAKAITWVARHISAFGGDPEQLVLAGHSAGAQIAALLATDPQYLTEAGMDPKAIRGVVSFDAVGLNVRALTEPGSPYVSPSYQPAYWNAFGTPAEDLQSGFWDAASVLLQAGPEDPPFFLVVARRLQLRMRENREMSRLLGQRVSQAVFPVPRTHPQINTDFGSTADMYGMTVGALDFIQAVTSDAEVDAVVGTKRRKFRLRGGFPVRKVTISAGSRPAGAALWCRLDQRPVRNCRGRRTHWVGRGSHRLTVRAYDAVGRLGRVTTHGFRVIPAR